MSLLQAVLFGIVQGATEFLPVSSSGHLAILRNFLGISQRSDLLFDVLAHAGTLVALVLVFYKDLCRMLLETAGMLSDVLFNIRTYAHNARERDALRYRKVVHGNYRCFVMLIAAASIPTAIIGYVARDLVVIAGQSLITPGICLILNACLLLVADVSEDGHLMPKDVPFTNGFLIGVAQGLSVLPGLSRAGTTISAGLLSGFDRRFAVKYSFLMSVPVILGACVLEIFTIPKGSVAPSQIGVCVVGAVFAGISGYVCIRKMLSIVRRKKFKFFAVYCLVLGVTAIVGYFALR